MIDPVLQWILDKIILVLSIVVSVLIVIWQIGKQFKNSLEIQRKNKVDELHLEIYKNIADKIEEGMLALTPTTIKIYTLWTKFDSKRFSKEEYEKIGSKSPLSPIKERPEDLTKGFSNAHKKVNAIILTMETYEIVFKHFTSMRKKIVTALNELREINMDFFNKTLDYFPVDIPEERQKELGKIIERPLPSWDKIEEIKAMGDKFFKKEIELISYLHDLRIEAQNVLLGPLFKQQVPARKPQDPRYEVLSLDHETSKDN